MSAPLTRSAEYNLTQNLVTVAEFLNRACSTATLAAIMNDLLMAEEDRDVRRGAARLTDREANVAAALLERLVNENPRAAAVARGEETEGGDVAPPELSPEEVQARMQPLEARVINICEAELMFPGHIKQGSLDERAALIDQLAELCGEETDDLLLHYKAEAASNVPANRRS